MPKEENTYQTLELHGLVNSVYFGLRYHVKRTGTSVCSNACTEQHIQTVNI